MKRSFDIVGSLIGLTFFGCVIIIAFVVACIDTKSFGFFVQTRVGRDGSLFKVIKIKTMKADGNVKTNVTCASDARITTVGKYFRKFKVDELPQLINVLVGHMSLVGPRPDVPGYYDKLVGDERALLSLRPGITGPASIKYRDEESLLSSVDNPQEYNDTVLFPDKVKLNLLYLEQYSLSKDFQYIYKTIFH